MKNWTFVCVFEPGLVRFLDPFLVPSLIQLLTPFLVPFLRNQRRTNKRNPLWLIVGSKSCLGGQNVVDPVCLIIHWSRDFPSGVRSLQHPLLHHLPIQRLLSFPPFPHPLSCPPWSTESGFVPFSQTFTLEQGPTATTVSNDETRLQRRTTIRSMATAKPGTGGTRGERKIEGSHGHSLAIGVTSRLQFIGVESTYRVLPRLSCFFGISSFSLDSSTPYRSISPPLSPRPSCPRDLLLWSLSLFFLPFYSFSALRKSHLSVLRSAHQ